MPGTIVWTNFSIAIHSHVTKVALAIQLRLRHAGTVPGTVSRALARGTVVTGITHIAHTRRVCRPTFTMTTAIIQTIPFKHTTAIDLCVPRVTLAPRQGTRTVSGTITKGRTRAIGQRWWTFSRDAGFLVFQQGTFRPTMLCNCLHGTRACLAVVVFARLCTSDPIGPIGDSARHWARRGVTDLSFNQRRTSFYFFQIQRNDVQHRSRSGLNAFRRGICDGTFAGARRPIRPNTNVARDGVGVGVGEGISIGGSTSGGASHDPRCRFYLLCDSCGSSVRGNQHVLPHQPCRKPFFV